MSSVITKTKPATKVKSKNEMDAAAKRTREQFLKILATSVPVENEDELTYEMPEIEYLTVGNPKGKPLTNRMSNDLLTLLTNQYVRVDCLDDNRPFRKVLVKKLAGCGDFRFPPDLVTIFKNMVHLLDMLAAKGERIERFAVSAKVRAEGKAFMAERKKAYALQLRRAIRELNEAITKGKA